MIQGLRLKNFRGVAEGGINGLTSLTVLVGPNGAGKSTILDAILVGADPDFQHGIQMATNRRSPDGRQPRWLVRNGVGSASIQLAANEAKRQVTLDTRGTAVVPVRGDVTPVYPIPGVPLSKDPTLDGMPPRLVEPVQVGATPLTELYTRVAEQGRRREAKALLKDLIQGLDDIEILTQEGQATVYLVFPNGAHPAALAGDGLQLLLKLGLELASKAGGAILLAEPETHLHPGAIRQASAAIWAAIRRDVQVVLTTHSLELIDALLADARLDEIEKLSLHRVRLEDGKLITSRLGGDDVAFARASIQDDLR